MAPLYLDVAGQGVADGGGLFIVDFGGPMDGETWDLRRVAVAREDDPFAADTGALVIYTAFDSATPSQSEVSVAFPTITTPYGVPLTSRSVIAKQHQRFIARGKLTASQTYVVTGLVIVERG